MSYIRSLHLSVLGLHALPDADFVLPVVNGSHQGQWLFSMYDDGHEVFDGYVANEARGWELIADRRESQRRSMREMLIWRLAGDRADDRRQLIDAQQWSIEHQGPHPNPIIEFIRRGGEIPPAPEGLEALVERNVLRHDRNHYVVHQMGITRGPGPRGFGGRVFRWRWLDDATRTVYESNDVWHQGKITAEFADLLPDNVEWVENTWEARPWAGVVDQIGKVAP